ncbi:DNA methyltransferase 1-associated protein dmap1 [Grosmannia clavigera kw1407]|uniref:SWR1-complex protein 4 n=1 Tax=Grosmannia clavigera (strain kw1407 / UAMH 11150) TaxID=655863 RepID=F0XSJ9_GROCL|nr:DNA methyltransferase 1-associated protein dmap1 [Grosmannia clavigera kw1407]EFW99332.1 DNA methyltransferase 1-associated protein dmap1 [Grosmannia clavigera kw1407]
MSSSDVRDVLSLHQDGAGSSGAASRPSKKQKTGTSSAFLSASRSSLKGLAREIQSLGGANPIAIVPQLMPSFKKRRIFNRKPTAHWELRAFKNSAREDGSLVLRHWRRQPEASEGAAQQQTEPGSTVDSEGTVPEPALEAAPAPALVPAPEASMEDSVFAKFNVKVVVPQYNDDQYNANLVHPDWTREETDYLLELVKDFDLRWPLIWDRYDYRPGGGGTGGAISSSTSLVTASGTASSRSMEDLKARYYEIAAKMMAVQKPAQYMTQAEYNLHGMMANFKPQQEKARKAFVSNALTRSRDEVREEEALLLEVRRIMARVERTNEERRELYNRLDFPHADTDISSFKTSSGLHTLLQSLMFHSEKSKKRKSLAAGEVANPMPGGAAGGSGSTAAVGGAAESGGRRDSIAASAAGGHHHHRRDSSTVNLANVDAGGAAAGVASAMSGPGKNKKGGAQAERRKLTDQERDVYGVTYHDRLGSGPTFRYEKINKLFSHKSGQQQLRITNILNELDMPARLFMPTAAVTAQFEQLVNAVVQLVDLRKGSDKLDSEIKIEEQRKMERDKTRPPLAARAEGVSSGDAAGLDKKKADAVISTGEASAASDTITADGKTEDVTAAEERQPRRNRTEDGKRSSDNVALKTEEEDQKPATTTAGTGTGTSSSGSAEADADADTEDGDPGRLAVPGSRPGSSSSGIALVNTGQKRSASVLSAASDKSAKRQKK